MLYSYLGFFGFTLLVILFTSYKLRKDNLDTSNGYFFANKSLSAPIIAGSMLLTNISTEHLIGMNGSAYRNGIIVIAWEITSAIALVIAAIYIIPRFIKMKLTTIPEFLEKRFDSNIRFLVALLLLSSFVVTLLPVILYSGALNIESIFDFSTIFSISKNESIVFIIVIIGIIGSAYSIFGGLKAIAISNSLNGIGLMIGGLLISLIALYQIGAGNIFAGINNIYQFAPKKFDIIGSEDSVLPFSTLFTGLMINQIYFWGMNQTIVQRALSAKNLEEAQKGILITGGLKLLTPLVIVLPGLIGYYYFQEEYYSKPDLIYPLLVKKILPSSLYGFFAAVILGAVLGSFNNILNSASTIFCIDIYKKKLNPNATDEKIAYYGKISAGILAIISISVAPLMSYTPSGFYFLLQELNGIFFIPISSVLIAGLFVKQINAAGAKAGLFFGILFYLLTSFILHLNIHFVHLWGIEFILNFIIMLLVSKYYSKAESNTVFVEKWTIKDEKSWSGINLASSILICMTIIIYIILS